ncbi:MAG: hypothetical protein WD830_04140 [Chloroflexota bacterium]
MTRGLRHLPRAATPALDRGEEQTEHVGRPVAAAVEVINHYGEEVMNVIGR